MPTALAEGLQAYFSRKPQPGYKGNLKCRGTSLRRASRSKPSQLSKSIADLRWASRQSPIASVQRTRSILASHSASPRGTTLIFFPLLFLEKGKPPKRQGFFCPHRTPKIPGKERKNAQKHKEFLAKEKNKEFQKTKERKDRESPIANAVNSRKPFRMSTWNEYYTNERQSRDSNRSATNAGSTRTKFCVFRGDMTANER